MSESSSPRARGFAAVIAVVGWATLVLQYWLTARLVLERGGSYGRIPWVYFSYFTILTNALVAAVATAHAMPTDSQLARWLRRDETLTGATASILLVGVAYNVLLRQIWNPQGAQRVADELLHVGIPLATLMLWVRVAGRAELDWRRVIAWIAYPVAYLILALLRGRLTGEYPYPFLDVRVLGVTAVAAYAAAIGSLFLILCSGLLMIARARVRPAFYVALLAAGEALAPAPARAQTKPAKHIVQSDGHPLTVWSKRPAKPVRAILLVHGRTWSTLPDFDLQVPGERRSLMDALVAKGYAVYGVDLRGYGATPRDASQWDTPVRSADDVANVLKFIQNDAGVATKPALFGWSNGSAVGALTALRRPELMSDLILFGYFLDPDSTIAAVADTVTPLKAKTTPAGAAEDFIAKDVISQKAIDAYVKAALAADPVRTDWRRRMEFNAVKPSQLRVPTLLLQGEFDPIAPTDVQARFFSRIGTADKQWTVIAGGDHAALLEDMQPRFVQAIVTFLERPRGR